MDALQRISKRVARNGEFYDEATPVPLLTLSEFFDGNEIVGSIGCNLPVCPHPAEMRQVLEQLEARGSVDSVRVQVTEMDVPDWPFSDTVWIVTTDSLDHVRAAFPEALAPDEVWEGFRRDETYEHIHIPDGHRVVAAWWD